MRIRNGFEEFICVRSSLSNDNMKSEIGYGKSPFWSEIVSGFGEQGGTPPPRIPRSTPGRGARVGVSTKY